MKFVDAYYLCLPRGNMAVEEGIRIFLELGGRERFGITPASTFQVARYCCRAKSSTLCNFGGAGSTSPNLGQDMWAVLHTYLTF